MNHNHMNMEDDGGAASSTQALPNNWRVNWLGIAIGQFFSNLTSMIVQYAILWYLTDKFKSANILAWSSIAGFLPMALLSLFAGILVDRFNKKVLLIVPDMVVAAGAIILSIVGWLYGSMPLALIFVVLIIRSSASAFQSPTLGAAIPTLVPKDEINRANGLRGLIMNSTMIIAPPLAAVLYVVIPMEFIILIDVIGALISSTIVFFARIPETGHQHKNEKIEIIKDFKFGITEMSKQKGIFNLTILGSIFYFLIYPTSVLYPLLTTQVFHGTIGDASIMEMSWFSGAVIGGVVLSIVKNWRDRMIPIGVSIFLSGVLFVIIKVLPQNMTGFWIFAIANFITALTYPAVTDLTLAMTQNKYKQSVLGRVLGVQQSILTFAGPIGMALVGPLTSILGGIANVFVAAGWSMFVVFVVGFVMPTVRNLDKNK